MTRSLQEVWSLIRPEVPGAAVFIKSAWNIDPVDVLAVLYLYGTGGGTITHETYGYRVQSERRVQQ